MKSHGDALPAVPERLRYVVIEPLISRSPARPGAGSFLPGVVQQDRSALCNLEERRAATPATDGGAWANGTAAAAAACASSSSRFMSRGLEANRDINRLSR